MTTQKYSIRSRAVTIIKCSRSKVTIKRLRKIKETKVYLSYRLESFFFYSPYHLNLTLGTWHLTLRKNKGLLLNHSAVSHTNICTYYIYDAHGLMHFPSTQIWFDKKWTNAKFYSLPILYLIYINLIWLDRLQIWYK